MNILSFKPLATRHHPPAVFVNIKSVQIKIKKLIIIIWNADLE
jgi:hypothetical protein